MTEHRIQLSGGNGDYELILMTNGQARFDQEAQDTCWLSPKSMDRLVAWWAEHRDEARKRAGIKRNPYECKVCGGSDVRQRDGGYFYCESEVSRSGYYCGEHLP